MDNNINYLILIRSPSLILILTISIIYLNIIEIPSPTLTIMKYKLTSRRLKLLIKLLDSYIMKFHIISKAKRPPPPPPPPPPICQKVTNVCW